MAKQEKPFQFPKSILNQVEECSSGGFLLFVINDQGQVEPFMNFNSEVVARSLNSYCEDFTKAFRKVNAKNMLESMSDSIESDMEDEDGEL